MDKKVKWSHVCKTMRSMEKGNEKAMFTVFLIVWEPERIRWNCEVLGLKQTKPTFSYRFLKSLSQDAAEAEGVSLLKKLD